MSDKDQLFLEFAISMRSETLEGMAEQINEIVGRIFESSSGQRFLYAGIHSVSLIIANEFHVLGEAGEDPVPQRIYEALVIPQIEQLASEAENVRDIENSGTNSEDRDQTRRG